VLRVSQVPRLVGKGRDDVRQSKKGETVLGMGVDEGLQNAESIGDEWEGVRVRPKTFGL